MNAAAAMRKRITFRRQSPAQQQPPPKKEQSTAKRSSVSRRKTDVASTTTNPSTRSPCESPRPSCRSSCMSSLSCSPEENPVQPPETFHVSVPPVPPITRRRRHDSGHATVEAVSPDSQNTVDRIARAAAALDNAGNELFEQGQYDRAMTSYTRALKLKRRTLSVAADETPDHVLASVATSINNIGYLRQRSGATAEETMRAYRDSLQIKREILGSDNLSVGKTLNNIGSVYFSTRELVKAMEAYEEARAIMEQNLGKDHLDVATVYSNIGDVHMKRGEGQLAHDRYKDALIIRWKHLGEHDPKVIRLLEKIAAIEMEDSEDEKDEGSDSSYEDCAEPAVQVELQNLHTQVQADITYVDNVKRQMALDMVKDKLRILRGMRQIELLSLGNYTDDDDDIDLDPVAKSPPFPLSPMERNHALVSVKERLARLKESRAMGGELLIRTPSVKTTGPDNTSDMQDRPSLWGSSRCRRNSGGLIGT